MGVLFCNSSAVENGMIGRGGAVHNNFGREYRCTRGFVVST